MTTVTLSAKYQVVIPKKIREELQLRPGQKLTVRKTRTGEVGVSVRSPIDEAYGMFKGAWGKDSTAWLEKQRAEANRVRY
jgi:AbrB family looped-hinge helix DNA binding protein